MFAQIKTNGATDIIIHIPHEGAEKSLPALAAMLEQNAVFIQDGYNEHKIVKPEMSILLGDRVNLRCREDDVVVKVEDSGAILDESFIIATPQVFASNAASIKKKDEELTRLRTELSFVKSELGLRDSKIQILEDRLTAIGTAHAVDG